MVTIKIQDVYSNILNETKKKLVVTINRKTSIGPLFFQKDPDETLKRIYSKVTLPDDTTADEIIINAYKLLQENNMIAAGHETLIDMAHWFNLNRPKQWMNYHSRLYPYGSKTEEEMVKELQLKYLR